MKLGAAEAGRALSGLFGPVRRDLPGYRPPPGGRRRADRPPEERSGGQARIMQIFRSERSDTAANHPIYQCTRHRRGHSAAGGTVLRTGCV